MKFRIISILLVIISIFAICPVCFADGSECFVVTGMESGEGFELSEPICVNGTIVLSGVHSKGDNQYLTMIVTDDTTNEIYAMGETESSSDGKFHFDFGLRTECHGKNLALYVDGGEGTTQAKINFVFCHHISCGQ